MNQDQNYITLEMNLKLQMKDYRIVLGVRKFWITTLLVVLLKLAIWLIGRWA